METNGTTFDDDSGDYFYQNIDVLKEPWVSEPHFVPLVVTYGIVFLLGIAGNGVVIFSVLWNPSFRNATFYFIVSLAVADVLFLLVVIPHETLRMVFGEWSGGRTYCKISGFTEMLTAVASILNLTAVSFERYFVITLPIQSRRRCTIGNTRRVLVAVWLVALIVSAPSLYVKDIESSTYFNNVSSVTLMFCSDHGLKDHQRIYFAVYQLLVMFVIPTVLMGFCYTVVIYVLWISRRTLVRMTASPRPPGKIRTTEDCMSESCSSLKGYHPRKFTSTGNDVIRNSIIKGRKQVIKMLMIVVITFLFCWGPKLVFQLFKYSDYRTNMHFTAFFKLQIAIYCLPYIQSCLNPVIYGLMSENFRKGVIASCQHPLEHLRKSRNNIELGEFEMESKLNNGTVQTFNTRTVRNSNENDSFMGEEY